MQLDESEKTGTSQICDWITSLKSNVNPLFGYSVASRCFWHQVIPNFLKDDCMAFLFILKKGLIAKCCFVVLVVLKLFQFQVQVVDLVVVQVKFID